MHAPQTQTADPTRRNTFATIAGESLWGFAANMVLPSTVLVVALRMFGGPAWMIGSIASIETAGINLPQLLGVYLFRSRRRRKRNLLLWHVLIMIPMLPLMGITTLFHESLSPAGVRWILLLGYAWFNISTGIIMGIWWDWMAHLFEQRTRGTVLGFALAGSALAGTLGALIASATVSAFPGRPALAIGALYLLAGMIMWISMTVFSFIRDPDAFRPGSDSAGAESPITSRELLRRFRHSCASPNFRRYLVGRVLAMLGFCMMPLVALYYTSPPGGALSDAALVRAGFASALAGAAAHVIVGKLGDRRGFHIGMLFSVLMQVVTLAIVLMMPGELGCLLAFASAGFAGSSGFLAHTNLLLESSPHEHRSSHITMANMLISPAGIVGPLVAGALMPIVGGRAIFLACMIISLLACGWFLLRVRDPRRTNGSSA